MGGERLDFLELTPDGVEGDRLYAFESSGAPPGMLRLTGPERRHLLAFAAATADEKTMVQTLRNGRVNVLDPRLRDLIAQGGNTITLTRAATPQTDVRPLSIISLQTVAALEEELGVTLDVRRFRANLVLDLPQHEGLFPEDAFTGKTLAIGPAATVRVLERDPRCRFITYDPATPAGEPLTRLMKLLHDRHQGRAGVYASVATPGLICNGDAVRVVK